MELLTPILRAIGLFVATNIDDIIVPATTRARSAGIWAASLTWQICAPWVRACQAKPRAAAGESGR